MDKNQTAVEWLIEQVNHFSWGDMRIDIPKETIKQAKAMEKQQIIDARVDAPLLNTPHKSIYLIEAEQYYNETYGK